MEQVLTPPASQVRVDPKALLAAWWPIMLGMAAMFVPTFYGLLTGLWSTESYAHGPIILGLALWLLYSQWPAMLAVAAPPRTRIGAWALFLLALVLYTLGRSQSILIFEIGSFVMLLVALVWMHFGMAALRRQWFPFFFMLFMIPLPGGVVSALTLPMKMAVSYVTEHVLYFAGYPIARSGVVLQIGQYQLLVADACAGLQTLLTLEALGLFYLNLVRHTSAFRNVALACLIIPISFTANVIRVVVLTLITYYFGDAAGQGFLHGFAGMVLFITALILIISLDSVLQLVLKARQSRPAASILPNPAPLEQP